MNYKLLMESWRKFLDEDLYEDDRGRNPPPNVNNVIDLGDRDPTAGDPEREKLRIKLQKDKKMMKAIEGAVDESFPIVNGKNFELPLKGNAEVKSGFDAARPGGPHLAHDQFVALGTEVFAAAKGRIINNNTKTYDASVEALAKLINRRRKQGLLMGDVATAMGITIGKMRKKAEKGTKSNRKKMADGALAREKILRKFMERSAGSIMAAPLDWPGLQKWANDSRTGLGYKLMPNLFRYYNKSKSIEYDPKLPTKGLGFVLVTDPDQYGNQFGLSYAHMEEAPKNGAVEQGSLIGTVGSTGLFDPWNEHLHLGVFVINDSNQKIPDSKYRRRARWIDPGRIIKGLGGTRNGVYAKAPKDHREPM